MYSETMSREISSFIFSPNLYNDKREFVILNP